jgi:hypothetical protein
MSEDMLAVCSIKQPETSMASLAASKIQEIDAQMMAIDDNEEDCFSRVSIISERSPIISENQVKSDSTILCGNLIQET